MSEIKNSSYIISDQTFDRREDIYAFQEFNKIVNRYTITDQIYSDDFWKYLKENFKIKEENIIEFCDIHSDVKNRVETLTKYIITINKPYKIQFQFYDEEKVDDDKLYESDEEKRNKITDLIIYFDSERKEVKKIVKDIRELVFLQPINKTFFIISSSSLGYDLRPAKIKEYDIPIDLNYGEAFVDKYETIVDKLKNNKHGLFLFHGDPGCGKTMLIRKLVSELSGDKTIIYVPSYFMFDIANPEMISFISKFKNSILLLEDAEMILTTPQEERSQAVANILNISDGLLNDHMDMQIIATFNINRQVIDDALLRKGRMMVDYKFKKLNPEQSTKLSKYIGLNKTYTEDSTLAEIYEEKVGKQLIDTEVKGKKLGFGN